MDRGAWWATVRGVAKSWTRLSDETTTMTLYHTAFPYPVVLRGKSLLPWPLESCAHPGLSICFSSVSTVIKNCQPDRVPFLFPWLRSLVPNVLITSTSFMS